MIEWHSTIVMAAIRINNMNKVHFKSALVVADEIVNFAYNKSQIHTVCTFYIFYAHTRFPPMSNLALHNISWFDCIFTFLLSAVLLQANFVLMTISRVRLLIHELCAWGSQQMNKWATALYNDELVSSNKSWISLLSK